jgi:hypothetical protein
MYATMLTSQIAPLAAVHQGARMLGHADEENASKARERLPKEKGSTCDQVHFLDMNFFLHLHAKSTKQRHPYEHMSLGLTFFVRG